MLWIFQTNLIYLYRSIWVNILSVCKVAQFTSIQFFQLLRVNAVYYDLII